MSTPILYRRLKNEYEEIKRVFRWTKYIKVVPNEKDPPDEYKVFYKINGIGMVNGKIVEVKRHIAQIYLSYNYFEIGPTCTFLTPHFHPNIYPKSNKFCAFAGAFRAGESLTEYIFRLGEILQFKSYNLSSPANVEAKKWVLENLDKLPLDTRDLRKKRLFPNIFGF